MADKQSPVNVAKQDRKPRSLTLLPTGTNRDSYVRSIEKIRSAETRKKLEEMLRDGHFSAIQEVLKSSLRTEK